MSAPVPSLTVRKDDGTVLHEYYLPLNKLDATAAPTVTDDDSAGYVAGSFWIDRTNHKVYVCQDNATGAAVWAETPGAAGTTYSADESTLHLSGTTFSAKTNGITAGYLHATTTSILFGRSTAGAGAGEEINLAGSLAISGGTLSVTGVLLAANNLSDVASVLTARSNLGLGSAASLSSDTDGTLSANSDGVLATQKAVKTYVDTLSSGIKWKQEVRVASTANVTVSALSAGLTIDGVTLADQDRVLLKDQSTASQNGIYRATVSGGFRTDDADTGTELVSAVVFVRSGTANADKSWVCTNDAITIGSTSITWVTFASSVGALLASNNLSDLVSASTARTNLGLGTLAIQNGTFSGTSSGTNTGDQTTVSGNAGTATALQTARTINGVSFDGTANITVTAAAGTLTGTTLNGTVVTSSLTAVGTIAIGVWNGTAVDETHGGTAQTGYTKGDILVASATNALSRLAGDTSTARKFLRTQSTGVVANPPAWDSILFGDLPAFTGLAAADPSIAPTAPDEVPGYDVSGTANAKFAVDRLLGLLHTNCGMRLTLTAGTPVTTSDVTGATSVSLCPYLSDSIALYDGTRWIVANLPEFGIALGTLTSGKPYDVFAFVGTSTPSSTNTGTDVVTFAATPSWQTGAVVYAASTVGGLTAGTAYYYRSASTTTGSFYDTLAHALAGGATGLVDLTANVTQALTGYSLELLVWTNDTTRATAVTIQDGRYCKSGDKTRLLVGAFYTTATTTTESSLANRYLWNVYNRVHLPLKKAEAGSSWGNAVASWTSYHSDATNQVAFLCGLPEAFVHGDFMAGVTSTSAAGFVGLGLDWTSGTPTKFQGVAGAAIVDVALAYNANPGVGRHYLRMCEFGGTGVTIFGVTTNSSTLDGYVVG
jgi:hypothetical protein